MDVTNIIVSIVTAVTAVIAIIISVVQITKSNKQSLFDRRLNAYLTVKWMKSLCDENKSLATSYLQDGKTEPIFSIDLMFNMMTNCNYLEEIQGTLSHALESEYQRKYLLKIETLRNLCEEVRLIFPKNIGYPLADFIFYYEEMLVTMYKYQVAIDGITKECQQFNRPFPKDHSLENRCRTNLIKYLSGTFELAERLWKEGTLQKAVNQIKL